jgi:hypothetical protein
MNTSVKFDMMRVGDIVEFLSKEQNALGPCVGEITSLNNNTITIKTDAGFFIFRRAGLVLDKVEYGKGKPNKWVME